jgi:hypothetical protein
MKPAGSAEAVPTVRHKPAAAAKPIIAHFISASSPVPLSGGKATAPLFGNRVIGRKNCKTGVILAGEWEKFAGALQCEKTRSA